MTIPNALRARMMAVPIGAPPAGGAIPPQHTIGVVVDDQIGDNWCWAAVSVGIRNSQGFGAIMRQCELVRIQLGHSDFCTDPVLTACDVPNQLEIALENAGVPADNLSGALLFSALQSRIAGDKPVCCAIQWASGSFHFVQIDGYMTGGPRGDEVIVNDSAGPGGRMSYDTLVSNYGVDSGRWVWTYRVL